MTDITSWREATPWGRPRLDDILAGTAALSAQEIAEIISEWRIYPILLKGEFHEPGSTYLRSDCGVRSNMDGLERVIARETETRGLDSGPFAASSRYGRRLFDQLPELLGDADDVHTWPDEWPGHILENETLPQRYREAIETAEDALARLTARLDMETAGNAPQADRTDSKTDKSEKSLPENPEVLKLAKAIKRKAAGETNKDVALVFAEGNDKKAESLLRQIRRFPRLLE